MSELAWVVPYRNEALTVLFKMISHTGEEWFLLSFLAIGYWCVNKKLFRDLTIMVCISTLLNVLLKSIFMVPRPMGGHLMAVNDVYSFPSGHAQVATIFWLLLAIHYKKPFFWWLAGVMIIGQCLSRVYLGVHFPSDVLAGFVVGSITVVIYTLYRNSIYWPIFSRSKWAMAVVFALSVGLYYFCVIDNINKNNMLAGGALIGIILGHLLEHRFCDYQRPNSYLFRFGIAMFGLITLFGLKLVLKAFAPDSQSLLYVFGMYFVLGVYIVYLVPTIAQKFNKF